MADNWADNAPDVQDNAPLPDDLNEVDANRDSIGDDGTKPKRPRALTSTSTDDITDELLPDDVPKPKRGRGRPKKDDDTPREPPNIMTMRRELEELRRENNKLSERLELCLTEKSDMEQDLQLTRSSLMDKEQDYADLLDQFASHEEESSPHAAAKPVGLVLFDEITEPIVNNLCKAINWTKTKRSLSDMLEYDDFQNVDVVLIATGSKEISQGTSAFQLHQTLRKVLVKISEHTLTYVVNIPPNNHARVQVDLYNHKMGNMDEISENVRILKIRFLGSKADLVNFDGSTPSDKCLALYEESLVKLSPPKTLKIPGAVGGANFDFEVTAVVQIKPEMVGRIIGKGGAVIRRITDECKVKMSFGNWREKNSENREVEPDNFMAVMVKGLASNVKKASCIIDDIIKNKVNLNK